MNTLRETEARALIPILSDGQGLQVEVLGPGETSECGVGELPPWDKLGRYEYRVGRLDMPPLPVLLYLPRVNGDPLNGGWR